MPPTERRTPSVAITYPFSIGLLGGGARHARELARYLGRAGARVTLLAVAQIGRSSFPRPPVREELLGREHDDELARDGVRVVRVAPHPLNWRLDRRAMRAALRRLLDEGPLDAVVSFAHEGESLPRLLRPRGVRFAYAAAMSYGLLFANPEARGRLRRLRPARSQRAAIRRRYREADLVLANSEFTRGELVELLEVPAERVAVTYLGVDEAFHRIPRAADGPLRRLIFFGRYDRSNGIGDALEALALLDASGLRDWELRLFGQGDATWIEAAAHALGLAERVHVGGGLGDAGLRAELERAQLALLPSHSESFGLAIAESQAAGLPVVAYAAGAVPEVVEDGVTAWLAPLGDVPRLAERLAEALADPERAARRGAAGRARMARLFTWERTAERALEALTGGADRAESSRSGSLAHPPATD